MLDCCTASRARLDSTEGSDTDAAMADPRNSGNPTTSLARFDDSLVTTTFELPGFRITRNLGVVRGITVRSRSIVGNFLGASRRFSVATPPSTPSCANRPARKPAAT